MKKHAFAWTLVSVLLCTALSPFAKADNSSPSANGDFQFTVGDGVERSVKFNARIHSDGTTSGEMTYVDPGEFPISEDTNLVSPLTGIYAKAAFDCLVIQGNKAVMSGVVTESNVGDLLGHRVLLVVEDSGEGVKPPGFDKLAWGVYQPTNRNWIPQDAEVPGDNGSLLDWIARDSEREDDAGIPARRSETIGCQTFSLSSYAFVDVQHGQGNIQVRP